ncbi:MAG: HEAT repeat domain-containing protein [Vicinamibacterales bacterium]
MIEALSANDSNVRIPAAEKLGELGAQAAPAIPFLVNMLKRNGSIMETVTVGNRTFTSVGLSSDAAASALGRIGKLALEPLRAGLVEPGSDWSWQAAKALAQMKDPAATQILLDVLKRPS